MSLGHRFWGGLAVLILVAGFLSVVVLRDGFQRVYISPDASPMTLSVKLSKENICSRISPEFEITGIPDGVQLICLSVRDLNTDYDHGGGCIVPTQSTAYEVNAGALIDYRGPCSRSRPHSYRFRLEARNAHDLVVGLAESTLSCCNDIPE